jgi:hypothetical protein
LTDPEAFDAFEDDAGRPDSTTGFLSGLGLPVPDELFFLKTSRKRPTGDGERRAGDTCGNRPVLLAARVGAGPKSSVLVLWTGKVDEKRVEVAEGGVSDDCDGWVSRWTAACTMGEDVVRQPI